MKKVLIAGLFLLGFITAAQAQNGQRQGKPTAEEMTERLHEAVTLSKDQYNQVLLLHEEMMEKMEDAGGPEADRETKREIRKTHKGKLLSLLTEEQVAKLKQHRKEHHRPHSRSQKEPSEG
jgi:hypothetical protein